MRHKLMAAGFFAVFISLVLLSGCIIDGSGAGDAQPQKNESALLPKEKADAGKLNADAAKNKMGGKCAS